MGNNVVHGFKVFNPDWTCRGKVYTCPGKFEENVKPIICDSGMHFCKKVGDCFNYYKFTMENKVAEVIAYGDVDEERDKCCTNKLEVVREIPWDELIEIVNTGKNCTGIFNSGNCNSGSYNTGRCNSGMWNSGSRNRGIGNSGDLNSGSRNSGDWNRIVETATVEIGTVEIGTVEIGTVEIGTVVILIVAIGISAVFPMDVLTPQLKKFTCLINFRNGLMRIGWIVKLAIC